MSEFESWGWDLPEQEPKEHLTYNRRQLLARTGAVAAGSLIGGGLLGHFFWPKAEKRQGHDEVYLPLKWESMHVPSRATWAEFSGDPTATKNRASWARVGVVLTELEALQRLIAAPNLNRRPAIAFYTGEDRVQVGVFKSSGDLGNIKTATYGLEERYYAIGMRIGPGALRAKFGVIDPFKEFSPAEISYAYRAFIIGQPHPETVSIPIV